MSWTTPKTWANAELLTSGNMNTHLRDNLNALKTPPTAGPTSAGLTGYTNTSYTNIGGLLTMTTHGGAVMMFMTGTGRGTGTDTMLLGYRIDGGTDVEVLRDQNSVVGPMSFALLITGLSAASHTFQLRVRSLAGASVLAGIMQFWVREIS